MTRWTRLMIAAAAVVAAACGSDGSSPIESIASATKSGTDSSGNTSNNGNNSGSNTVGLVITPANLTLAVGWYGHLTVANRDANGALTPKRATLTSSNPAIVAVYGDTGLVQGKAVGTATITATVDGATATATVTVTTTPPPTIPTTTPPPLAEFSMKVVALGRIPSADTSKAERIGGATVKLLRVGGVTGDTLKTPVDAGSAVTNANGEASFSKLAGGTYEIRITPPASSGYQAGFVGFGPPRTNDFTVNVSLVKP